MIDVENEIFDKVATMLRETYPLIYVTGEYVKSPPAFPCVSIVEVDNSVRRDTSTSSEVENHANVTYEVNVYSNKTSGKKGECRSIAKLIDEKLANLGFTRFFLEPVPNLEDATIYRILGRYRATVGKDQTIYRR